MLTGGSYSLAWSIVTHLLHIMECFLTCFLCKIYVYALEFLSGVREIGKKERQEKEEEEKRRCMKDKKKMKKKGEEKITNNFKILKCICSIYSNLTKVCILVTLSCSKLYSIHLYSTLCPYIKCFVIFLFVWYRRSICY